MFDVVALGEVLIDFTPQGKSERKNDLFECNPGGAPANVLAFLAKLNKKTSFIGKVGEDDFGHFLKETLRKNNIGISAVVADNEVHTTLAFVQLKDDGDRSFTFYRNPGADMNLTIDELNIDMIKNTRIFHFGSLSLTDNPIRETTFKALEIAKEAGVVISYDPNLREPLWENLAVAREMIRKGLNYADVVKISEEELLFLTGIEDIKSGSLQLIKEFPNVKLLLVTLGPKGSFYCKGDLCGFVDGFKVQAVDTTGAGDSFFGGILYQLLEKDLKIDKLTKEELDEIVTFANAGASIVTTRYGAISIMPTLNEIKEKQISHS